MASAALPGGAPYEAGGGGDADPRAALHRLAALGDHMAAVRRRIAASLSGESRPLSADDIHSVSSEISSTARLVLLNAASLLASSVPVPAPAPSPLPPPSAPEPLQGLPAAASSAQERPQIAAAKGDGDYDIVELQPEELLAEHSHLCKICGKGFRREANLRMHMRAHGDRFKTLDALSRPGLPKPPGECKLRFSCPSKGCNRNRAHPRFRPLKSAVCARNHFRRSHCAKLFACERCGGKKRFAVVSDLRSHLRHCGQEAQWRCSCGTTFSRKDKLFGHIALFEGHTPALTKLGKEVMAEPEPTEALLEPMEEGGSEVNGGLEEDEEDATFSPKDKMFGHIALLEGNLPALTKLSKEVVAEPDSLEILLEPMEEGAEGNGGGDDDEEGGYDSALLKELMDELRGGGAGSN